MKPAEEEETPVIDEADYRRIEAEIASADSPVGIDAKKTHVMILAKLERIEARLDALEGRERGRDLEERDPS